MIASAAPCVESCRSLLSTAAPRAHSAPFMDDVAEKLATARGHRLVAIPAMGRARRWRLLELLDCAAECFLGQGIAAADDSRHNHAVSDARLFFPIASSGGQS